MNCVRCRKKEKKGERAVFCRLVDRPFRRLGALSFRKHYILDRNTAEDSLGPVFYPSPSRSSEAATGAAESGSEATGGYRLSDIPGRPREEETRLRDISFSRAEIVILAAALELYEKSLRKSDSGL